MGFVQRRAGCVIVRARAEAEQRFLVRQGDDPCRLEAQPLIEHVDLGVPGVRFHHHALHARVQEQPFQDRVHHRGGVPRLGSSRRRRHQQVHADIAGLHRVSRGQR